jgi:hypothetical protein
VSRRRWQGVGLAAVVALGFGGARPAQAYVRSTTDTGKEMCWSQAEIHLSVAAGIAMEDLDSNTFIAATKAAAAVWNEASLAPPTRCTQLQLVIDPTTAPRADAAQDMYNQITFREDVWHREPCDPAKEKCGAYDTSALAITSTYAHTNDGTIVGGDIEINGINFKWADVVANPAVRHTHQDVQNALAHELGHFIGLDHTCYLPGGERPRPTDYHGNPVPNCGPDSSAEIKATTMYASADPGDIMKRDLSPDDIQAVCDLFPAGKELPCAPHNAGGGGGCTFGGAGGGCTSAGSGGRAADAGGIGLAVALGALLIARKRRR